MTHNNYRETRFYNLLVTANCIIVFTTKVSLLSFFLRPAKPEETVMPIQTKPEEIVLS